MKTNFENLSEKTKSEIIEKLNNELSKNEFRHSISSLDNLDILSEFGLDENIIRYKIETFVKTGKWIPFHFIFLRFENGELSYDIFSNHVSAIKAFRDETDRLYKSMNCEDYDIVENDNNAEYSIVDDEDWEYRGIVLPFLSDDKYILVGFDESIGEFCLWSGSIGYPLKNNEDVKKTLLNIVEDEEYVNEMIAYFISSGETIETRDKDDCRIYLRIIELV